MTVTLKSLSKSDQEYIGEQLLHHCYGHINCSLTLALALHQYLGWQMCKLTLNGSDRHYFVRFESCAENQFWDARGQVSTQQILEVINGHIGKIHDLSPTDVQAVLNTVAVPEYITYASELAQLFWPHLPWKTRSIDKHLLFARELESLCARFGVELKSHKNNVVINDRDYIDGTGSTIDLEPTSAYGTTKLQMFPF